MLYTILKLLFLEIARASFPETGGKTRLINEKKIIRFILNLIKQK